MQNTKGKFALKMEDGAEVRNIDDLKAHFDIGSVVRDFSNGKLLTWLEDRYYDEEADAIRKISTNEGNLEQKLCAIFGIESEWIIERRNRLKKYTNDRNILANADKVAFDQEDLADLLDEGASEIYLCANRFVIPLRMKNKTYIGVKDAVAVIRSKNLVNFDELGIKFQNIAFDDDYRKILDDYQKILDVPSKISINSNMARVTFRYSSYSKGIVEFTNKASLFRSDIKITVHDKTVDAKNFVKVIYLNLNDKDLVTITAVSSDAEKAVIELKECLQF